MTDDQRTNKVAPPIINVKLRRQATKGKNGKPHLVREENHVSELHKRQTDGIKQSKLHIVIASKPREEIPATE